MGYGAKSINDLVDECYANAKNKGFYETRDMIIALIETSPLSDEQRNRVLAEFNSIWKLSRIALLMSELGEMAEAARKPSLMCEKIPSLTAMEEEAADLGIRLFDYMGSLGVDLDNAIRLKMLYNETRPKMHGKLS